jgi:hypothetical protein
VRTLLLSALDLISERRMDEYGLAFEAASTAPELARLARRIYDEDVERGNITVLGEMVAGGASDAALGAEVAARIEPWIGAQHVDAEIARDDPERQVSESSSSCWTARRWPCSAVPVRRPGGARPQPRGREHAL